MSRAAGKPKDSTEDRIEVEGSNASDEGERDEDAAREETPDLYRNSALGM